MHSVERSTEPSFLAGLRSNYSEWNELQGTDRYSIRIELANDFDRVCAYCEQPCAEPIGDHKGTEASIEHFRPRKTFPLLWLDWLNLLYSCRRCNQEKGDKWPIVGDATNQRLGKSDGRYDSVIGYVNPNGAVSQRPANDFFDFDIPTGDVIPNGQVNDDEWSMARRTIEDIDLNTVRLGPYSPEYLPTRRRRQVHRLLKRVNELGDFEEKVSIVRDFMLPGRPFSSFVASYIAQRFPEMA